MSHVLDRRCHSPVPSLWTAVLRHLASRRAERLRRAALSDLLDRHDDRLLRDVGLEREEAERLVGIAGRSRRREDHRLPL